MANLVRLYIGEIVFKNRQNGDMLFIALRKQNKPKEYVVRIIHADGSIGNYYGTFTYINVKRHIIDKNWIVVDNYIKENGLIKPAKGIYWRNCNG